MMQIPAPSLPVTETAQFMPVIPAARRAGSRESDRFDLSGGLVGKIVGVVIAYDTGVAAPAIGNNPYPLLKATGRRSGKRAGPRECAGPP